MTLDELDRLATATGQRGPWIVNEDGLDPDTAAHIEAFSPAVVRAMIACVRSADAMRSIDSVMYHGPDRRAHSCKDCAAVKEHDAARTALTKALEG